MSPEEEAKQEYFPTISSAIDSLFLRCIQCRSCNSCTDKVTVSVNWGKCDGVIGATPSYVRNVLEKLRWRLGDAVPICVTYHDLVTKPTPKLEPVKEKELELA